MTFFNHCGKKLTFINHLWYARCFLWFWLILHTHTHTHIHTHTRAHRHRSSYGLCGFIPIYRIKTPRFRGRVCCLPVSCPGSPPQGSKGSRRKSEPQRWTTRGDFSLRRLQQTSSWPFTLKTHASVWQTQYAWYFNIRNDFITIWIGARGVFNAKQWRY